MYGPPGGQPRPLGTPVYVSRPWSVAHAVPVVPGMPSGWGPVPGVVHTVPITWRPAETRSARWIVPPVAPEQLRAPRDSQYRPPQMGPALATPADSREATMTTETSGGTSPHGSSQSSNSARVASPDTAAETSLTMTEQAGSPQALQKRSVSNLLQNAFGTDVGQKAAEPVKPLETQPDPVPSSSTLAARHRDQPGLAFFADAFVAGEDEAHLERGCRATVKMHELPAAGRQPDLEDSGEAEWPLWTDPWRSESEAARGGATVFVPSGAGVGSPCMYFVHGGGFEWGSPLEDGYDSLCSRIAEGSGMIVVCPDHPLSGENRSFKAPAILDALVKGLRWLVRFDPVAKERRAEVPQILLAGDSAGATQAMSILLQVLAEDALELQSPLRGLVLISPWLDLTCGSHTYVSNAFSAEAHTGDLAFRSPADENRAGFRGMALTYAGSAGLLKDCIVSPYWLARDGRGESTDVLRKLEKSGLPAPWREMPNHRSGYAAELRRHWPARSWTLCSGFLARCPWSCGSMKGCSTTG
ncbi:unnamed protein product [Effrenium voratum]|uniref:Alpha/beta hydrolase fold-3 domain-containing protein n=1 Tax=Effrenium voratum TaxID=2562239 RepID=A0AA36IDM2_9DINO|nr:unnamed protein product [Effrenium voratum]CAJ1385524.1 unnamed protein product [Effrenium voratum]